MASASGLEGPRVDRDGPANDLLSGELTHLVRVERTLGFENAQQLGDKRGGLGPSAEEFL
jgi:hypothetical protein